VLFAPTYEWSAIAADAAHYHVFVLVLLMSIRLNRILHTAGGDVAERIDASDSDLQPGDVVEIDSDHPGRFVLLQRPAALR
jgi:hypothetical protein